jgi:sugar-specific transcriptional regulator TrmB
MSEEDLSSLVDFGLTKLQARAYVALLKLGTARASQLSSTMGVIRPEVYRLLRELCTRGLVQKSLGYPSTFSAVPPDHALSILTKQHRESLITLNQKKRDLTKSLSGVIRETNLPYQGLSVIIGGDNLVIKLKEMIGRAEKDYVGIHSKYGLRRWLNDSLAKTIVSAKKRKVRIRLIAEKDETSAKAIDYLSRWVEVRLSKDVLFYMDIVDGREMVFGPAFPLTDEEATRMDHRELDLSTINPSFVRGMYAMFDTFWEASPRYVPSVR